MASLATLTGLILLILYRKAIVDFSGEPVSLFHDGRRKVRFIGPIGVMRDFLVGARSKNKHLRQASGFGTVGAGRQLQALRLRLVEYLIMTVAEYVILELTFSVGHHNLFDLGSIVGDRNHHSLGVSIYAT